MIYTYNLRSFDLYLGRQLLETVWLQFDPDVSLDTVYRYMVRNGYDDRITLKEKL